MRGLNISDRLAEEIRDWAENEKAHWPEDTAFQADLSDLLRQLQEPCEATSLGEMP